MELFIKTTCSNTPQQNGVAERKNRHLLEVIRSLLITDHMPLSYWGEAAAIATYLINHVPSSSIEFQTPLQAVTTKVISPVIPDLPLRVFGCVAFIHLHKHQWSKLNPRALRCVSVGYAQNTKGYRCYHPPTKHTYVTMDIVFHEEKMFFSSRFRISRGALSWNSNS